MRLYALKVPPSISEDTLDRLLHHLPEAAQDRVRKFRHEADAIRSVAGRLLPTWYLRRSGLVPPPTHPEFETGPKGKPFLAKPQIQLDFNTSHEGAYVLLAVNDRDVGVDVMDLPSNPEELEDSISYQLTPHERLALAATRGRVKAKLLTTLWTIKEGYTKAIGEGIAFGLDRIEVDPGDGSVAGVRVDGRDVRKDGWRWAVGSLEGGAYGYAVIWRGEESAVEVETVGWDEFIRAFIGSGKAW
ncbi:hypothetical protein CcaverHIS002_0506550 [Cutaneotrichosporon cavernicola]|uniref:holo-[acyl-carrier-protein] synthase n=1 Tax=Cutaneotrichosporon cavernicola TaxID=279322 RepID=A0AA48L6R5_9TREE|nr:uncharacterized protein CcaverHIS019_0507090 [Cutaneotrichosporon cavernicola]BEI85254.1 hypothetical protein CcaverHIS002_0506550 [Cutaneotrichosporon cavernicola]BEI93081.1 hypothetical protein CcaverHIS019_0507090 [Cutaneotrichosporon cavernicola]